MAENLQKHNFFGFDATVVADSQNSFDDRLTTMVVTFPRIVLAEFNTHRMFSRNSASSRAIPYNKMVERVKSNPFIPIAWQKEHTGMQGSEYLTEEKVGIAQSMWLSARDYAVLYSEMLDEGTVTKQLCNRLLEPFLWHTCVVSSTEWENFFSLRCPQYFHQTDGGYRSWSDMLDAAIKRGAGRDWVDGLEEMTVLQRLQQNKSAADIHIQMVAEKMWDAMNKSVPKLLQPGQWHIPFGDEIGEGSFDIDDTFTEFVQESDLSDGTFNEPYISDIKRRISVAICARLSYGNIDPNIDYAKDLALYDRLYKMKHASPFEHCAQAMMYEDYFKWFKGKADAYYSHSAHSELMVDDDTEEPRGYGWCLNFRGFIQERALIGIS